MSPSRVQGEEVQLLGQIELCFTKDLQLRGCAEPGEPAGRAGGAGLAQDLEVCKDGPVFYPPPP